MRRCEQFVAAVRNLDATTISNYFLGTRSLHGQMMSISLVKCDIQTRLCLDQLQLSPAEILESCILQGFPGLTPPSVCLERSASYDDKGAI